MQLASVELRGKKRGCGFGDGEANTRERRNVGDPGRKWTQSVLSRSTDVRRQARALEDGKETKRGGAKTLSADRKAGRSPGLDQTKGDVRCEGVRKEAKKLLAFVSPDDSDSRQLFDLSLFGQVVQRSPAAAGTSW